MGLTSRPAFRVDLGLGTEVGTFDEGAFDLSAFDTADWTDVADDLVAADGKRLIWQRGMGGNGPRDDVAVTGALEFWLRNDAGNSGGTQAWYSPNSVHCRTGFQRGIPVRLVATFENVDYVLWTGKIAKIDPMPGRYGEQRTHVYATDCMDELASNKVRTIPAQVDQDEVTLVQAVLAALPAAARPVATDFDAALDTYPYAFDDLGAGDLAMGVLVDVMESAQGKLYPYGNGALHYENRHALASKTSDFVFDNDMHGIGVPSDVMKAYNRIRLTIHKRTPDVSATIVLCRLTQVPQVSPGQTIEVWGRYEAIANTLRLIGGTDFQDPLTSGTDWTGNTAEDGSGTDMTSSLTVTVTPFASTAKFTITNTSTTTPIYPIVQLRGRPIYFDSSPATMEAYSPQDYGERQLEISLRYQNDANVTQDMADYLVAQHANLSNQADFLMFKANDTDALMRQALTREIGDVVTGSEQMTGLAGVDVVIRAIAGVVAEGPTLEMTWLVAPTVTGENFILDESTLDDTAVWSYA